MLDLRGVVGSLTHVLADADGFLVDFSDGEDGGDFWVQDGFFWLHQIYNVILWGNKFIAPTYSISVRAKHEYSKIIITHTNTKFFFGLRACPMLILISDSLLKLFNFLQLQDPISKFSFMFFIVSPFVIESEL